MPKIKKYKVLIVGAGQIGAFYDSPKTIDVLSHAHAFSLHPGFELAGFVDIDLLKARAAAKIWGGQAFATIDSAFTELQVDVVVNATPDHCHFSVMKDLLSLKPKLIFAEKPLAKSLPEASQIMRLARLKKIPVAVDYRRRFVPEFIKLRQEIRDGLYGQYLSGSGYYGKGLLHNGSHLLDLLLYLVSEPQHATVFAKQIDYSKDDPSLSALLRLSGDRPFFLQSIDHRLYTIFELDLLFTKARITIADSGFNISKYVVKSDSRFKGYKNMTHLSTVNTSLNKSLYFAVDNIYQYLNHRQPLICSVADGCQTMAVAMKIINSQ